MRDAPNASAGLSRRDVVKFSSLATVGAWISAGGAAATSVASALAARPKLTPQTAANQIAKHLGGREVAILGNKKSRAFDLDRYLAHRDKGQATVQILERMKPPRSARAARRGQPGSIPTDRVSAATEWWGYEVRFPHTVMMTITNTIIGHMDQFDGLKDLIFAAFEDVEVLEPYVNVVTAYVLTEWAALQSIDNRTGKGAAVKASWLDPVILVPTTI